MPTRLAWNWATGAVRCGRSVGFLVLVCWSNKVVTAVVAATSAASMSAIAGVVVLAVVVVAIIAEEGSLCSPVGENGKAVVGAIVEGDIVVSEIGDVPLVKVGPVGEGGDDAM